MRSAVIAAFAFVAAFATAFAVLSTIVELLDAWNRHRERGVADRVWRNAMCALARRGH